MKKQTIIKLLIADDHAIFRDGLRSLLESEEGFIIEGEAGDGFEALTLACTKKADILLLDVSMPGINAPQIVKELKARKVDIKIIILTMHEDEYYLSELLRLGVHGYVLKKSTASELVSAIRSVFFNKSFIDPALAHHLVAGYTGKRTIEKGGLEKLTKREVEVLTLLALGYTNEEVGENLFISRRTVDTHRANIQSKLNLKSRAELVRFALDNGLLS